MHVLFYAACDKISNMENYEPNYKMHNFTYLCVVLEPTITACRPLRLHGKPISPHTFLANHIHHIDLILI